MGRTKLNDAVREAVVRDLTAGLPRAAAALRAGISASTFRRWMRKGRRRTAAFAAYYTFAWAVRKAEQDAVARNVATIQKAAQTAWRAAAWWLERKYPDTWAGNRRELAELKRHIAFLIARQAEQTANAERAKLDQKGPAADRDDGAVRPPG